MNKEKISKDYQNIDFDSFDDMLTEYHGGQLLLGVYNFGFERPSAIQAKSIIPISEGHDILAQAQSGSGKTGAFGIGILTRINPKEMYPQAIIMANTKDLAMQIAYVVEKIGIDIGVKVCLCIGGTIRDSEMNLGDAEKSHVLVCTPGRLGDLIDRDMDNRRSSIKLLDRLKILVLDEADILLGTDFRPQMQKIINSIPENSQICLFSATYPPEILKLTELFLNNPVKILVEKEKVSVDGIKNYFVSAGTDDNKYQILDELYRSVTVTQTVIFVNSVNKSMELTHRLRRDGHTVGVIHGKLDDTERNEVLRKYRLSQFRVLVATNVISRGIDIAQVGLIINYDVPQIAEEYIHRVGRSGRFGKVGVAITFVGKRREDKFKMENIERLYKIGFYELPELEEVNKYLNGGTSGYNFIEYTD